METQDSVDEAYRLVQLANGAYSLRSTLHGETFHPVIGPVAEAEALYVNQLRLPQRLGDGDREFVIWDVGLGAAANAIAALQATRQCARPLRVVSFDRTLDPLAFALRHADALGYFRDYAGPARELSLYGSTTFQDGGHRVRWELRLADFPSWLVDARGRSSIARASHPEHTGAALPLDLPPAPDAVLYDAYSPAKNPSMWSLAVFTDLQAWLDPKKPCSLATYSRSTMLRVTLLLAGFFVGRGHATGEKEETTIAANTLDLISEPLDARWLSRAMNSTSAEPLSEPVYRQAPLSIKSREQLLRHCQFKS